MGQFHLVSVFVCDFPELNVRVVEHGENVICGSGDFSHLRQNIFFLLGKDVGLFPQQIADKKFILRQSGLLPDIRKQRFLRSGQKLRREEGHGRGNLGDYRLAPVCHGLIFGLPVILVPAHPGVNIDLLKLLPDGVPLPQGGKERSGAFCQAAGKIGIGSGFL